MTAIPKPKKTNNSVAGPQLTEYDFIEIGEKIGEALEFGNEVEITTYHLKQYESARGIITSADGQKGKLTLQVGLEDVTISINAIVSVT
ncbi:YolD-like family protein [Sporosarcina beigongshangi]|uniref:YolD-like family protein n=1 Tax=Sporosarcina beigongshangi TaxID=2782538 RepID=UPI00193A348D|nr:YolD-like family protein [Sporosarcina beigongshangi]